MKNPKVWGLLIALMMVIGVAGCAKAPETSEGVSTDTPKNTPNTVITVIGGKVTYEDKEIARILDEKYNITVNVLTNSGLNKFEQNGVIDYAGVEVIMGGSAIFADELKEMYPDGLPNSAGTPFKDYKGITIGQSPLVLHVKTENGDIDAFTSAGIFEMRGTSYTVSSVNILKIIDCQDGNDDWASIGVNIPGKCRFGFTNPAKSSGGKLSLAYLASCMADRENPCTEPITVEKLDSVLPFLLKAFEVSGKKSGDEDSVLFYFDWANSDNAAERIMFAYESAPISWLNSAVPAEYRKQASSSIALVYPEFTFMSTQVGIALDDQGKNLVEIMTTDQEIIAALNNRIGFRAGYRGKLPQILPSISMDQAIFTSIPDPKPDVSSALVKAICARWPETPGCKK